MLRLAVSSLLLTVFLLPANGQAPAPRKKKLLAIGAVKGFQHDAVSHGMATLWKIGQESGLWDTYIRTDTELLTKSKLGGNAKNLDYFDALFFYTTGEIDLSDQQKKDLLSFVKEDGKGFLGSHSAADTLYKWPEYGEMIGGYFDLHPWNQVDATAIVEDGAFPAMRHFPPRFVIKDEIYQFKEYSRDRVRVLMSMDADKVDLTKRGVHRADKDFALTWVRNYGKGRVFYSALGHREDVWDRKDIQTMWLEAVKWAMGLTQGTATPRPKASN
ncbi:MAG: ThuA domain-containing protein [Candidatus Solibacter usitatus]|nr:ThuA domain-containing protein [Candidatus Solibacter usitatus]